MSITAEKQAAQTLTYAQYLAEATTNRRYEILDGVRRWIPNPTVRHQDVLFNIAAAFKAYSRTSGAVEVLRLSPEREETLAVYSLGEVVQSVVFPGLAVASAEIFAV